jgi:phospholipid N-methyltransferase
MNPTIYTSGQNAKSFYPTPATLAAKMLCDIDFRTCTTILKPSAGKGDLLDACMLEPVDIK